MVRPVITTAPCGTTDRVPGEQEDRVDMSESVESRPRPRYESKSYCNEKLDCDFVIAKVGLDSTVFFATHRRNVCSVFPCRLELSVPACSNFHRCSREALAKFVGRRGVVYVAPMIDCRHCVHVGGDGNMNLD